MNVGVYISCLNEENLIAACIKPVLEVFPQVEVIDLDSKDSSLSIVKSFDVPLRQYKNVTGADWTDLKNALSLRHDWVLFIDGDEIFPVEQLHRLRKEKLLSGKYDAYRVGWKNLRVKDNKFQVSSFRVNGAKMWKPKSFYFKRAWPREVLEAVHRGCFKEPKDKTTVWCYHGVLLNRSSNREATGRRKKREVKIERYDKEDTWTDIDNLPWEENSDVKKFTPYARNV